MPVESSLRQAAQEFTPAEFINGKPRGTTKQWDLLILNQPVQDFHVFECLWKNTDYRICADGAANRLFDMFEGCLEKRRADFIPTAIHGDLDSLRDDTRQYYEDRGSHVTRDPDQYSTDFGKCLQKLQAHGTESTASTSTSTASRLQREVIVLGSLSGRVDHGLGLLHEFLREKQQKPDLRLWLFSESSISFLLSKGANTIHVPLSEGFFTPNIGIIPVCGPSVISTRGLEWDVEGWETRMGHQVSTSNHIVADTIEIETSELVLFTVERAAQLP